MTYVLLIYRATGEPVPRVDEQATLRAHRAMQAEAAARGELRGAARLDAPSRARTVRQSGGAHDVADGPYMEAKEWLVGFYLVDCDDEAQAIERAQEICVDEEHVIEVRPVTWAWDGPQGARR